MYLVFYLVALFRLGEIDRVTNSFLPGWAATGILVAVITTAGVGIPLRCYLFTASAFDDRRRVEKFQKLFLAIFVLVELWVVAPFRMSEKRGFGAGLVAPQAL